MSHGVSRCITVSHNVHIFTIDVTYVQKGVRLVTKVCYYLEFSYIYKYLIINKKALCLIAEGCTSGAHITNCISITYVVLFPDAEIPKYIPQNLLRAYLPDDFPEMIQRLAKVLRN